MVAGGHLKILYQCQRTFNHNNGEKLNYFFKTILLFAN